MELNKRFFKLVSWYDNEWGIAAAWRTCLSSCSAKAFDFCVGFVGNGGSATGRRFCFRPA